MPCPAARARILLKQGRAVPVQNYPFTIRLLDRTVEESVLQPLAAKFDPGSKTTGVAVVREDELKRHHALFFNILVHRGDLIRDRLKKRANYRRRRRGAHLRYRAQRSFNRIRGKKKGWLPPSLNHRVDTTVAWAKRLLRVAPITSIYFELVKFDLQKLMNPEISGIEYQHGELFGYEVREYLLEKFDHQCAYCGAKDVPLNIDHVIPRAKGGTNRISNLVVACVKCNLRKGARSLEDFLKDKPAVLSRIREQIKTPLKDAHVINATRWKLLNTLKSFGLPVETANGAETKYNRFVYDVPKEHWLDALCVGFINGVFWNPSLNVLEVKCTGRGMYARTKSDKYGFPRTRYPRTKRIHGFATGDMVEAVIPKGKYKGVHQGRAVVRTTGRFGIKTSNGRVDGISWQYFRLISYCDGYGYSWINSKPKTG